MTRRVGSISHELGIDRARISPAELCVRMLDHGYFDPVGESKV